MCLLHILTLVSITNYQTRSEHQSSTAIDLWDSQDPCICPRRCTAAGTQLNSISLVVPLRLSAQRQHPPFREYLSSLCFWNYLARGGLTEVGPSQAHVFACFVPRWGVREGLGVASLEPRKPRQRKPMQWVLLSAGRAECKALSNCTSTMPSCLAAPA